MLARGAGAPCATVRRILRRHRLSRWRDLDPPPPPPRRHGTPGPATSPTASQLPAAISAPSSAGASLTCSPKPGPRDRVVKLRQEIEVEELEG